MERQEQYVDGVSERQRSSEEKRAAELGLERLFWAVVRLQSRVDDLEAELAELKREN
jgi:hypothetical protein